MIIESPTALKTLMDICECGTNALKNLKLEVVTFGSDDYLAAIGLNIDKNECDCCRFFFSFAIIILLSFAKVDRELQPLKSLFMPDNH